MENKGYILFGDSEDESYLKPCTFGLYEKFKLAQLNCTAIPDLAKAAIRREFNLPEVVDEKTEQYGLKGLYQFIIRNLFMEVPKNSNLKEIVISELNRATNDFLSQASGS